jgi:hypothetical protein
MENLFNTKCFDGIRQVFVDPCFKCQLRNECKDVEKFLAFEQSLARQMTDAKRFFNVDIRAFVNDIFESHKDELVCENFMDDETVSDDLSTYEIFKLQK